MDLGFFTNQQLFSLFRENKTKMATISDPVMLLRHLKDNQIITEAIECSYDPEHSEDCVYGVLDYIEGCGKEQVRRFWNCVNKEHILMRCSEINDLIQTLKNESGLSPDLSRVVAEENKTSERSAGRQSMEEPSTSFIDVSTQETQIYSVPPGTPFDLWNMPEHLRWLPVKCGEIEGLLDRESLYKKEKDCIKIEGQLVTPFHFEEMGGKGISKNWKMSILCQGIPLKTLIERDILRVCHQERKRKLVLHQ